MHYKKSLQEYDPWFDLAPEDCEPGYCNYDSYRRFVGLKDRYTKH